MTRAEIDAELAGCRVPTYTSSRGVHLAWDGWGRPSVLSDTQAAAMSAILTSRGKCGAIVPSVYGFCVCDRTCGEDDRDHHEDSRHAVVWDHRFCERVARL